MYRQAITMTQSVLSIGGPSIHLRGIAGPFNWPANVGPFISLQITTQPTPSSLPPRESSVLRAPYCHGIMPSLQGPWWLPPADLAWACLDKHVRTTLLLMFSVFPWVSLYGLVQLSLFQLVCDPTTWVGGSWVTTHGVRHRHFMLAWFTYFCHTF